ncbi:acyltransferase [Kitasatospora herbaricolor]|uniref:Acyltransferase n=1 Tax=Kitasatospora herbaricolor TaxID=68217 RepID=A0ABZ1WBY0_9ACTN|nr:acyltransferase [Kitasatospora herbaricolor]
MTASTRSGQAALGPRGARGRRIALLDGLRLVAALMVVFHHYVGYGGGNTASDSAWGRPANTVFHGGAAVGIYLWTGICLFFLISGFVICMSSWGRGLADFAKSRFIRLYPAYWFAVFATTAVLMCWPLVRRPLGVFDVLANLTMLQTAFHVDGVDAAYWTLWTEMQFYLLFAIVVWKGVTYRRVVIFCSLWTVASLLTDYIQVTPLDEIVVSSTSSFFIAGLAFYLMHRFRPNLLLWGIVGISWILSTRYALNHQRDVSAVLGLDVPLWPAVLLVTLAYLVLAAVALGWGGTGRIRWRWLTVAGALTYPLYLLHEAIGWTAIRLLRPHLSPWPSVALVTASMLVAAWLVHRFVERPLAPRLKDGMTRAIRDFRATPAAAAPVGTTLPAQGDPAQESVAAG